MPTAQAPAPSYTGSCNPPRRAKRARTTLEKSSPELAHSDSAHDSDWVPPRAPPRLLPKPSAEPEHDDDTDVPKRRGRKPGGVVSRSARESMRKMNHSRIEKARRTKINDALAALRVLCPKRADPAAPEAHDEAADAKGRKGKPKANGGEEKEFKLEVLVRTVAYMEELIARAKELERGAAHCRGCTCGPPSAVSTKTWPSSSSSAKRKRAAEEALSDDEDEDDFRIPDAGDADDLSGDDNEGDELADDEGDPYASRQASGAPSTLGTPRLPPIASWMPLPSGQLDPSALSHLPSPPLSVPLPAKHAFHPPPLLTLPPGAIERRASTSTRDDDDEAASLLLQIRTSPTSPAIPISNHRTLVGMSRGGSMGRDRVQVQTPSALLGLGRERRTPEL